MSDFLTELLFAGKRKVNPSTRTALVAGAGFLAPQAVSA